MTKNRDLKRRIRARMVKTGERYTAARRHVVGDACAVPSVDALMAWAMRPIDEATSSLAAAVHDEDLEAALIELARDLGPGVERCSLWAALDPLVAKVRARVELATTDRARLGALLRVFHGELGFAAPEAYGDPALNLLDHVLETRRGTPAALAGLLIVLGRACELALHPVAFPGHFLVLAELDGPLLLDPATGAPASPDALVTLAMNELGIDRDAARAHLSPCGARPLVIRLLQNLGIAYRARGQEGLALLVADRLYEISGAPSDRCDRGLQLWAMGAREAAAEDVSAYLSERPDAADARALADALADARLRVGDPNHH